MIVVAGIFDSSQTKRLVKEEIFAHADWVELDRGALDLDQAIVRGAERTGLPKGEISRLLNSVPSSLTPFEETIDLIRAVKKTRNKLFVLSNMQFPSIAYLEETHDIWPLFDGIVISCRIKKVKPEPEIYDHLLSEYGLSAAETVFIDDMKENLLAAEAQGIQTIQFRNAAACQLELAKLGCL